ncbi:hypothetical protein MTO96_035623, partial [Rhipicephalus appendiculatus]
DHANESSYVCDELDEGDSDAEPPAPEAPVQDSPDGKKYIVFHSCLIQLLKKGRDLLEEAKQQPLSLAGDGSPLKCHAATKWQKEGLQRALDYLTEQEVVISSLVTDRHSEIKAFLKKYYPYIKHLFDLWHIGKGLRKKISSLGRAKQHEIVLGWRKTIIQHLYWCAVNSDGDDNLLLARFSDSWGITDSEVEKE